MVHHGEERAVHHGEERAVHHGEEGTVAGSSWSCQEAEGVQEGAQLKTSFS